MPNGVVAGHFYKNCSIQPRIANSLVELFDVTVDNCTVDNCEGDSSDGHDFVPSPAQEYRYVRGCKMSFKALSARMSLGVVHRQLHLRFPYALWRGNPNRREIALTFDDGPDPTATPRLLSLLGSYGVQATFFHI